MAFQEKSAWVMLLVTIAAYVAYLVVVLGRAEDGALADVPYAAAMLWSIGGAIVAGIVLTIAASVTSPEDYDKTDERDRAIHRFSEYVGQSFLVIGGVAALALAMLEAPHFWIANAVYLAFVLSGVLSSIAKLVAYRRGLPW